MFREASLNHVFLYADRPGRKFNGKMMADLSDAKDPPNLDLGKRLKVIDGLIGQVLCLGA